MSYTMDSTPLIGHNAMQKNIYIRVEGVDAGTFPIDAKSEYVACVGPRATYRQHKCDFPVGGKPNNVWNFRYTDAYRSSFFVALYKKRIFGGDILIGELELNVAQFKPNVITTQIVTLKSAEIKYLPPRVRISVHISENGAQKFCAPFNSINIPVNPAPKGVAYY